MAEQGLETQRAVLVYDTAAQPLTAGIRAVSQRARRLLFMTGETELMVQLAPTPIPARLKLVGQVLDAGEPVEGATVAMHGPDGAIAQATDDDGQFRIDGLPKGAYSVAITTGDNLLCVIDLALD
jgi:hypothetical protein